MAQMNHKDLIRQLNLIENAVKTQLYGATIGLKGAYSAGVGEGYITGQRERLKKSCTLVIGLLNQFVDSLNNVLADCDTMLKWFVTLPKSAQRQHLTDYGSPQLAASLDMAKSQANKLIPKVKNYLQGFVKCTAKPYPDISDVEELRRALDSDVELVSLTKGVVEDMDKAIELQRALAPEPKGAKERGGSFFGRLFGLKPAYGGSRP